MIFAACLANSLANLGFELRPVPTAVPPCASGNKFFHRAAQPRDAAFDLRGVAREFLSQRQRRCVLGVGSPDLDDFCERLFLLAQFAMQFAQGRNQVGDDAFRRRRYASPSEMNRSTTDSC